MIFHKPSKEIEKFSALDYVVSIVTMAVLGAVSILAIHYTIAPLSRSLLGDYHVIMNFFIFLLFYALLSAALIKGLLKAYPIRKGTYTFDNNMFFFWKYITMLQYTSMAFLVPLIPVALRPLKMALFGAKIGKDTAIGGYIDAPYLVTIGDASTIGLGSVVTGTVTTLERFIVGEVKIGKNVTIGMNAVIMPDVEIGDNAVVEIGSVVLPGSRIPSGERWRGNPARKWMLN